jgi:hypothetical protein
LGVGFCLVQTFQGEQLIERYYTVSRAMAAILDHFSDRLKAGARSDLLALAKITFIKSRTA